SATRSCDWMSASPSARDSLSPATAFSSTRAMSEDKIDPFGGEAVFDGQTMEQTQSFPLGAPQSVIQVLRQVINGQLLGDSQRRCLALGDHLKLLDAPIAGGREDLGEPAQLASRLRPPHGEHERQAGPVRPFLTQVPRLGERLGRRMNG